jgi:4-amino-4-deoxy-L-arabinose transferase-like glycosyltransferase
MVSGAAEPVQYRSRKWPNFSEVRRWPLAYALASSAGAYLAAAGNTFRLNGIVAWLVATICWVYAWWPRDQQLIQREETIANGPRNRVLIPLAAIVLVGIFFRFHRLAETPYQPTSDHAEKLLDVQDILDGQRPIFFIRNTGREPAQFYVIAGMVRFLGLPPNFDTMKLGTAAIDVLTIPAIYLLVAELGGRGAGLTAALAYSISAWPVGIARAGLRFPYAPLPTAVALWLLFRYLRRGDRRDALLLGLTLGVGLYGYSPFRVVPPLLPLAFGVAWLRDPTWRARGLQLLYDGLLVVLTAVVLFIPLGRYMLEQPNNFWYRATSRAVGDQSTAPSGTDLIFDGLRVFFINNRNAALAFNIRGDSTYVNAERWAPFLDTVTGVLFVIGVGLAIREIVVHHDWRWLIVLLSFPVLFLSSTLALSFPIENPSVNRAGPVLPVTFALVGLAVASVAHWAFRQRGLSTRIFAVTLLIAGFAVGAAENYERYFVRFDARYRDFVLDATEVAQAVKAEMGDDLALDRVYAVTWPYSFDTRLMAISLGDIRWAARHSIASARELPGSDRGDIIVVLNHEDQRDLQEIAERWPGSTAKLIPSAHKGRDFFMVRISELELRSTRSGP